jgi:hypothetical protein
MRLLALILAVGALVGCGGTARIVRRDGYGGVLALEGKQARAREAASRMIAEHCGQRGHIVTLEEEVPVGSQIVYNRRSDGSAQGTETYDGVAVSAESRTTAVARSSSVLELRITYVCGGAPAAAAPAPAVAPVAPVAPNAQLIIVDGATAAPPIVSPGPTVIVAPAP